MSLTTTIPALTRQSYRLKPGWTQKAANVKGVHQSVSFYRQQVELSQFCGCLYCINTYVSSEIGEWVDDGKSALCPRCEIDTAIGSNYSLFGMFYFKFHVGVALLELASYDLAVTESVTI